MNLDDDRVVDFLLQSKLHQKIPQDFVNHSCPALQEGLEPYFSHSSPRKKEKSQHKLGMSKNYCLPLQYHCHVEQILRWKRTEMILNCYIGSNVSLDCACKNIFILLYNLKLGIRS